MVVEADFAERNGFRMDGKSAEIFVGLGCFFGGIMRVHSDRGVDLRVAVGQKYGAVELRRTVAGADGQDAGDSGGSGAIENGVEVAGKALVVQMTVGIDEHRGVCLAG